MRSRHVRGGAVVGAALLLSLGAIAPVGAQDSDPSVDGRFLAPFAEPTVGGQSTDEVCVEAPNGTLDCKPTAGSVAMLPSDPDHVVYFNALEGTENVRGSIVAEFGNVSINAQARRLDLNGGDPRWEPTDAVDSGVNREGHDNSTLLPNGTLNSTETYNDGSLFCADLNFLPDGRVMTVGGTSYYFEPGVDGVPVGATELEGTDDTRVYDPETNTWGEFSPMEFGRWYPTLTTLADGRQFVVSGVTKLIKPVYPDRPADSGRNVVQTEIFDPATDTWEYTGTSGDKSLPLYSRMHLLPNGHAYYNTAGQVFNPSGQAYDEALWNIASAFDPETRTWTDLGVPGLQELTSMEEAPERAQQLLPPDVAATFTEMVERGQSAGEALAGALQAQDFGPAMQETLGILSSQGLEGLGSVLGAGFRGSTFSVMLPLSPDGDGGYDQAELLTAGGIVGVTPGTYLPVPFSRIDTVDTAADTATGMELATRWTGSLDTARWYSSGVLLPSGEVLAVNGATADEVVGPGTGFPVREAELFDPDTEQWRTVATQQRARTYHNTAALLPDGRVLLGGHDAISTLYGSNTTIPGGFSPTGRDPSFEIFEPPYLHYGVERPEILNADDLRGDVEPGQELTIALRPGVSAADVESVVLVRNPSATHLVDADQRSVELPVLGRSGQAVQVQVPEEGGVLPTGPYMLFVNRSSEQGPVPSVSVQVNVPGGDVADAEDRTNEAVGERDRSSNPGLTEVIPPADEVLPQGDAVPPTGTSEQDAAPAATGPAATTDREQPATGAVDAPTVPAPSTDGIGAGAATLEEGAADPAVLEAASARAGMAGLPLGEDPVRTALVALAMTGILAGAVAHVRLARRRWVT